jgi:hypothetical protein
VPICNINKNSLFGEELLCDDNQKYCYSAVVKSETVTLYVIDKNKFKAKFTPEIV